MKPLHRSDTEHFIRAPADPSPGHQRRALAHVALHPLEFSARCPWRIGRAYTARIGMLQLRFLAFTLLLPLLASFLSLADPFHLPEIQQLTLQNGIRVYLVEQPEVPIVSIHALIRAGSIADPPAKPGLASMTASLLRTGTRQHNALRISETLDSMGGTFEFEAASPDFALGSSSFPTRESARGLALFAEILQQPTFPASEVRGAIQREIDSLKQQREMPMQLLDKFFLAALVGTNHHPYGRPVNGDELSLSRLRRKDLKRFHRDHYGPRTITLAVAGDVQIDRLKPELEQLFGQWSSPAQPQVKPPMPPPASKGRQIFLVDDPEATQTFFAIGSYGHAYNHPDRFAIGAVNTAFGGRFTSILNDALRVNAGLTYGIHSTFRPGLVNGPFLITSYTANTNTAQAVNLTLQLLQDLHQNGLSTEQVESVQAYLKGQFPPSLETPSQVATQVLISDLYGVDLATQIQDRYRAIETLTPSRTRAIARQHFPHDDLTIVFIGKASEIAEVARSYQHQQTPPKTRSISQPGFGFP